MDTGDNGANGKTVLLHVEEDRRPEVGSVIIQHPAMADKSVLA